MSRQVHDITKVEAADRQLNQAIRLFFRCGDMLAVHTLTGAAFQLFADLGRVRGIVSRYRSEELIRPERMAEWISALNETQNFLKHADKDPGGVLKFVEEGTMLFLYEAVELATRVNTNTAQERTAFRLWFVASFPEMIEPGLLARLRAANTANIDQTDRHLWALYLGEA